MYKGHTRGLACIDFDGSRIVSGSNDKTIKIWDAQSGLCLNTLDGHTDLVRTLCFDNEHLVSGSYDQSLKVYDSQTGEQILDFEKAHSSWVFHVQMDKYRIVSASQVFEIFILGL